MDSNRSTGNKKNVQFNDLDDDSSNAFFVRLLEYKYKV